MRIILIILQASRPSPKPQLHENSSLAVLARRSRPPCPPLAQEKVLNLYSSRHYQTDEALYDNFTKQTGIKVNRIEAGEDPLIERMKQEGARSPADVLDHRGRRPPVARRAGGAAAAGEVEGARRAHPRGAAPSRRPLVRLLDARAPDLLRQGHASIPATLADLRGPRRPEAQGQDLHALELQRLQPLAHELDDRRDGPGEGRAVGAGRGREHGARAQGRRHRPAHGASPPANATSRSPTPTTTCAC